MLHHQELTERIIGLAIEVHRHDGSFLFDPSGQSPVAGSMTVATRETLFAGKPPQRACS